MKNYLTDFLNILKFEKDDADFLLKTYDKIVKNKETAEIWNNALQIYEKGINCNFYSVLSAAEETAKILYLHENTTQLLLCLCMTKRLKAEYENRGISEDIFYDTMLDFKYKTEECKLVKGVIGCFVPEWYYNFFTLKCFALGRLQFQLTEFGAEYQSGDIKLTPESKVLGVHIPRTKTPLDEESCNKSFSLAKNFFKCELGDKCVFTCNSWLLYPENIYILPKHSNVYKFMTRFEILSSKTDKDANDLWRLFDTDEKNPDRLPNDTSLRKAYIEHLKNGGKVGSGFGIYVFD